MNLLALAQTMHEQSVSSGGPRASVLFCCFLLQCGAGRLCDACFSLSRGFCH